MARTASRLDKTSPKDLKQELAYNPLSENTHLSITDAERALFAACFGKMIDQILAEDE